MQRKEYRPLIRWAGKILQFFAFLLLGFGMLYVLSAVLNMPAIAYLLWFLLRTFIWRFAVLIYGFLAVTVVIESLRT